jgi:leucyl aminopeptidase
MNGMRQMLYRQSTFIGILSLHTARCFSPAFVAAGFSKTPLAFTSTSITTSSRTGTSTAMTAKAAFPTWTFDEACKTMEWTPVCNATLSIQSDATGLEDDADFVLIGVPTPIKDENTKAADAAEEDEEDADDDANKLELDGVAKKIDEGLDSALSDLILESKFKAKSGVTTSTLRAAKKRYALLGVDTVKTDGFEIGKAIAAKLSSEGNIKTLNVLLPDAFNATVIRDLTTSLYQALYSPDARYKSKPKPPKYEKLEKIQLFSEKAGVSQSSDDAANAIVEGKTIASGIILAKDIVNAPHNVLNSQSLAETARRIPGVTCQIWGRVECEAAGMGAYLGVARGSETEPQFIVLTYEPPESASTTTTTVGVVGKGLLFDTGGYNIKTSMMELMKVCMKKLPSCMLIYRRKSSNNSLFSVLFTDCAQQFDCGGAAAVFGAARAIGELKPPNVKVHFVVAACENMINERAFVASDILTASNGKTIEVMNTDAVRFSFCFSNNLDDAVLGPLLSHGFVCTLSIRKGASLWPMHWCMPTRRWDVKRLLSCRR